jgi:hypothetical protein
MRTNGSWGNRVARWGACDGVPDARAAATPLAVLEDELLELPHAASAHLRAVTLVLGPLKYFFSVSFSLLGILSLFRNNGGFRARRFPGR